MEKEILKDFIKTVKYGKKKDDATYDIIMKKLDKINKKYGFKMDINLRTKYAGRNWTQEDHINVLFKNDIKELHYASDNRTGGYYLMMSGFFEDTMKIYISQGADFFRGNPSEFNGVRYKQSSWELMKLLNTYLIENTEVDKEKYNTITYNKEENDYEFDVEKVEENELLNLLKSLSQKIKKYPQVMKKFLEENPESEQIAEKYGQNEGRKRLFAKFNRAFLVTQNIYPEGPIQSDGTKENEEDKTENSTEKNDRNKKQTEIGKSIIYYGIPGSGKSHYIQHEILQNVPEECYERVTFYPEYTYYDFVGQKIPNDKGTGLVFEPGPFTRILEKALRDKENKIHYYLIIEEMNRGNAQAILGDIFQLLDRDEYGNSKYKITNYVIAEYLKEKKVTTYSEKIGIPSNLSIIATINTSDQNVFNLDTAFGRRWEYEIIGEKQAEKADNIYTKANVIGIEGITWNE